MSKLLFIAALSAALVGCRFEAGVSIKSKPATNEVQESETARSALTIWLPDHKQSEKLRVTKLHHDTTGSVLAGMKAGYFAAKNGVDYDRWVLNTQAAWDRQLSNRLAEIERDSK